MSSRIIKPFSAANTWMKKNLPAPMHGFILFSFFSLMGVLFFFGTIASLYALFGRAGGFIGAIVFICGLIGALIFWDIDRIKRQYG